MHIGKSYCISTFFHWTRRKALLLAVSASCAVALVQVADWRLLMLPWPVLPCWGGRDHRFMTIVDDPISQTCGRRRQAAF